MKNYQKAEMIAKNLPTGSYAAGCPQYYTQANDPGTRSASSCRACETAW